MAAVGSAAGGCMAVADYTAVVVAGIVAEEELVAAVAARIANNSVD